MKKEIMNSDICKIIHSYNLWQNSTDDEPWGKSKKILRRFSKGNSCIILAKMLSNISNWLDSKLAPEFIPRNEDECKMCAMQILEEADVEIDKKTEKFLEYNEDNIYL